VEILRYFEIAAVEPGEPSAKRDPEDGKFIWCALAGGAEGIISGDEHLLRLVNPPVAILAVAEVLRMEKSAGLKVLRGRRGTRPQVSQQRLRGVDTAEEQGKLSGF